MMRCDAGGENLIIHSFSQRFSLLFSEWHIMYIHSWVDGYLYVTWMYDTIVFVPVSNLGGYFITP